MRALCYFLCIRSVRTFSFPPFGRYTCGEALVLDFWRDRTVQLSLPGGVTSMAVMSEYSLESTSRVTVTGPAMDELLRVADQKNSDLRDPLVHLVSHGIFPIAKSRRHPTSLLDLHYDQMADQLHIRAISVAKFPIFHFQGICRSFRKVVSPKSFPVAYPKNLATASQWSGGINFQVHGRDLRLVASVRLAVKGSLDVALRIPELPNFQVDISHGVITPVWDTETGNAGEDGGSGAKVLDLGDSEITEQGGERQTQVRFRYVVARDVVELYLRIMEPQSNKVFYAKIDTLRLSC